MVTLSEEIQNMRKGLIDFGLRNKLLYYNISRKGIEIIKEDPREIFQLLVLDRKEMEFNTLEDLENYEISKKTKKRTGLSKHSDNSSELPDYFFDDLLNTPYSKNELFPKLFRLYSDYNQIQKNFGFSTLYIALGFITWKSPRATELNKAPLVLIPVKIKKTKNTSKYRVSWTEEDIITNLPLQIKLEQESGVLIPNIKYCLCENEGNSLPPTTKYFIDTYFENIKTTVIDQTGWEVTEDMVVDFFDFRKYALYDDLNPSYWQGDNTLACQTLGLTNYDSTPYEFITDTNIDEVLDPKDTYPILDADSSQLAIIEHAKQGGSIIVEGPPGTGKSQTIANIIAELLGQHKSILFVSDKMPALNVVKTRLDNAEFGGFCLELHSEKTTQTSIYSQIRGSILYEMLDNFVASPESNERVRNAHVGQLKDYRDSLNSYAKAIRDPIGDSDKNPIFFIGIKEKAMQKFDEACIPFPTIPINEIGQINVYQWRDAKKALNSYSVLIPKVLPIEDNPWKGTNPEPMFDNEIFQLESLLNKAQNNLNNIIASINKFRDIYGISLRDELSEVYKVSEIVSSLTSIPINDIPKSIFDSIVSVVDRNQEDQTIKIVADLERAIINNSEVIDDRIWDLPVEAYIQKYDNLISEFNKKISPYLINNEELNLNKYHDLFTLIENILKIKSSIREKNLQMSTYFKNYWHGEQSDPEELENISKIYQEISTKSPLFINISDKSIQQGICLEYILGPDGEKYKDEIKLLVDFINNFNDIRPLLQIVEYEHLISNDNHIKEEILSILRNHDYLVTLLESLHQIEDIIDSHCIISHADKNSRINNLILLEEYNNLKRTIDDENVEYYLQQLDTESSWISRIFKTRLTISEANSIYSNYKNLYDSLFEIKISYNSVSNKIKLGLNESYSNNEDDLQSEIQLLERYSKLKNEIKDAKIHEFIDNHERYQNKFNASFADEFLETNVHSLYKEYSSESKNLIKLFKYHSLKNQVDSYYIIKQKRSDSIRLNDLKYACKFKNYIKKQSTSHKIEKYNEYISFENKIFDTFKESFIEIDCEDVLFKIRSFQTQIQEKIDEIQRFESKIDTLFYAPINNTRESRTNDFSRYISYNKKILESQNIEYNRKWRRYLEIQKILGSAFHDSVYILNPTSTKEQYNYADSQYQQARLQQIESISATINVDKNIIAIHYDSYVSDLKILLQLSNIYDKITSKEKIGEELLGEIWDKEKTPISALEKIIAINSWLENQYLLGVFNRSQILLFKQGISVSYVLSAISMIENSDLIEAIKNIRDLNQNLLILLNSFQITILTNDFNNEFKMIQDFISEIEPIFTQYSIKWNCDNYDSYISSLRRIHGLQELRTSVINQIRNSKLLSPLNFDKIPKSELLKSYLDWSCKIKAYSILNEITETTIEWIVSPNNRKIIEDECQNISNCSISFHEEISQIFQIIKLKDNAIFSHPLDKTTLSNLYSQITAWLENIRSLDDWANYQMYRNLVLNSIAGPIIPYIEENGLKSELIVPLFEGLYSQMILNRIVRDRPALFSFIVDIHELNIEQFKESDVRFFEINKKYLKNNIIATNYSLLKSQCMSDIKIIREQLQKQKNRMSIRQMFDKMSSSLTILFPCIMMSPITVAQFIPNTLKFDVVIFDEASQIRPAEAMGSIMRGKQLIVIGDSQQLPPSDTFKGILTDGDEDEDDSNHEDTVQNVNMESILSLCKVKSSFPKKSLMWHYRSKHESLIAVSNKLFYDGKLVIFPSSHFNSDKTGLLHLSPDKEKYPDCYYVPKVGNRGEARVIADLVVEHFHTFGDSKSLGVATFNLRQKNAIEQELENIRINESPWIDEYINSEQDLFFVKNLESIQGDERDVIIVSVGFGYQKDGSFDLRFGPVTQTGGERRLNVLFTRAREKCLVVSNFLSNDLETKLETNVAKNAGLYALKEYLYYAQYREISSKIENIKKFDSPFEESVFKFLESEGYEVHTQVGCGRFRIDLAIVDPKKTSNQKYVLGIECDGATYHSSKVARDRDRLRQIILEGDKKSNPGLGWIIHRIWSTDWWRHRDAAKVRLIDAIRAQI